MIPQLVGRSRNPQSLAAERSVECGFTGLIQSEILETEVYQRAYEKIEVGIGNHFDPSMRSLPHQEVTRVLWQLSNGLKVRIVPSFALQPFVEVTERIHLE